MILPQLLNIALLASAPQSAVVLVESRRLYLPPLPDSAATARKGFRGTRDYLVVERANLWKTLAVMRAEGAKSPLPERFKAPKSEVEEVHFLLSLLRDEARDRGVAQFQSAWSEWAAYYATGGHRKPAPRSPGGSSAASGAADARGLDPLALDIWMARVGTGDGPPSPQQRAADIASWERRQKAAFQESNQQMRESVAMRNAMAPPLAAAWAPLAERLNQEALKLAALDARDQSRGDESVKALRLHARIEFLERFHQALHMCDVVWSALAAEDPPPPLEQTPQVR